MSYRGWHEPESHWVEEFICGTLGGAMGVFNFPGWLLVFWVSAAHALLMCGIVGIGFGAWLAYEAEKERRTRGGPQERP